MITDFKKWQLIEHLGTGEETFTQQLDMHGKLRNLDLYFPPGWEIEGASGKLTYRAELDVNSKGIEDIVFSIEKIEIEVEHRVYYGEDEEGTEKLVEFTFEKNTIGTDPKVNVYAMPYYLRNLEIDFSQAENLDGEIDLKKVKFEMDIGHIEN